MTYEEYFGNHTELVYRNVGVSMLPMLKQGRDIFVLKKKTSERCKKYDVVLYYRKTGQYVLHRIVEVHEKEYVLLGDNCENKEYGIKEDDILAVMDSFVRKGKTILTSDWKYQMYIHIWYWIYPLRKQIFRGKRKMGRIKRVLQKTKK
nr:S24/S26 family peptidase [uncultured Anaerobutyricum sp.]